MATTDPRHPDAAADDRVRDISQYLRAEASGPDPVTRSADGTIRDLQKALVERIADVDDDRRRSTVLLQKAFNALRVKTDERLANLRLVLAIMLGSWALLLAAGLGVLAWDNARDERALRARIGGLEAQLAAVATPAPSASDELGARVTQLASVTDDLAARVEALANQPAPPPPTPDLTPLLAPLQQRIDELAATLTTAQETGPSGVNAALRTELTTALAALRTDLDARAKGLEAAATALRTDLEARAKAGQAANVALRAELTAGIAALRTDLDALTRGSAAMQADLKPLKADLATRGKAGTGDPAALRKTLDEGLGTLRTELDSRANETREAAVSAAVAAVEPMLAETAANAAAEAARAASDAVRDMLAGGSPAPPVDGLSDRQSRGMAQDYQDLARTVPSPALAGEGVAQQDASGTAAAPGVTRLRVGERGYAVQLVGFHSRQELAEFIAGHTLPAQVYVRAEELRGQPWYVLIHSLHENLAGATAAQRALPPDLAELDVWIRSLPADAELETVTTGP